MLITKDEMVSQLQEAMCCNEHEFNEKDSIGFHEDKDLNEMFFKKKKGFLYKIQIKVWNGLKNLPFEFHKKDEVLMFAREFSKRETAICVFVSQWDSYGALKTSWVFVNGENTKKEKH